MRARPHRWTPPATRSPCIGDGNTNDTSSSGQGGASGDTTSGDTTTGEDGTAAGNQTDAGALAPIDATGNQVTVIGDGNSSDTSSTEGSSAGSGSDTTTGDNGTVAGNQTTRAPSPQWTRAGTR